MKSLSVIALCILLLSCAENDSHADLKTDSTVKNEVAADTPVTTTDEDRSQEKWFGMDVDDDTVIYEQDGKILTSGVITGTFYRMDRGDFMHYVVLDSNGYLHSFFLNTGDQRQMDKYYEGYEPARGHPVTVKWIRGRLPVSESGAMITAYQAKEVIE